MNNKLLTDSQFPETLLQQLFADRGNLSSPKVTTAGMYHIMQSTAFLLKGKQFSETLCTGVLTEMAKRYTKYLVMVQPPSRTGAPLILEILLTVLEALHCGNRIGVEVVAPDAVSLLLHPASDAIGNSAGEMATVIFTATEILTLATAIREELGTTCQVTLVPVADEADLHALRITEDVYPLEQPADHTTHIAMKPPFLRLPAGEIEIWGNTLRASIGDATLYEDEKLTDLLHICAGLTAWNYNRIYHPTAPQYLVGHQLSISRCSQLPEGKLYAVVEHIAANKRSQDLIRIFNTAGAPVYNIFFGYSVLSDDFFKKWFGHLKQEVTDSLVYDPLLPESTWLPVEEANTYRCLIGPFTSAHCLGHFPEYPFVPAVFLLYNLIKDARKWLLGLEAAADIRIVTDTADISAMEVIPINTVVTAHTRVMKISKKKFRFISRVSVNVSQQDPNVTVVIDLVIL
ncbi:hypothetical protein [Chitinophaga nivalis]|uniref:Uncharacterized protein n=1 Tax=Chitinophaga nivalis TaxID=2991709 RepID=A0ABT3IJZ1_9BACT|nr:hypothetical protein [Chitinophaga nivalis]MCW3466235.1 hypothetical protein [Chitinophaga nivalis]MCW3484074.1 hypothetical protein [Chitinophaga nivalis]